MPVKRPQNRYNLREKCTTAWLTIGKNAPLLGSLLGKVHHCLAHYWEKCTTAWLTIGKSAPLRGSLLGKVHHCVAHYWEKCTSAWLTIGKSAPLGGSLMVKKEPLRYGLVCLCFLIIMRLKNGQLHSFGETNDDLLQRANT